MTTAPTPVPRDHARRRSLVIALAAFAAGAGAVVVLGGRHDSTGGSTVQGSGVPAEQTRAVAPFRGVELAGANVVTVKVGGRQSVVVHADDNLLGRVTTIVRGGRLVIGNRGSYSTTSPMHVDVTVPALDAAILSGSGTIVATGSAARLDASVRGSGELQLGGLAARDVTATVSGSGLVEVRASRSLRASVSGSGAIVYGGEPSTVSTSVTGSGAVIPG